MGRGLTCCVRDRMSYFEGSSPYSFSSPSCSPSSALCSTPPVLLRRLPLRLRLLHIHALPQLLRLVSPRRLLSLRCNSSSASPPPRSPAAGGAAAGGRGAPAGPPGGTRMTVKRRTSRGGGVQVGGWGWSASGARQLSAQAAGRYLQGLEPSTARTAGGEPMDFFDEEHIVVQGDRPRTRVDRGRPRCFYCCRRPGERVWCVYCDKGVGPGCCLLVEFHGVSRRHRYGICVHCLPTRQGPVLR